MLYDTNVGQAITLAISFHQAVNTTGVTTMGSTGNFGMTTQSTITPPSSAKKRKQDYMDRIARLSHGNSESMEDPKRHLTKSMIDSIMNEPVVSSHLREDESNRSMPSLVKYLSQTLHLTFRLLLYLN